LPSYELTGPERVYSGTRDVNGRPLGTVQPGDIRMFDDAPDSWWVPVIPPRTGEAASSDEAAEQPGTGEGMTAVEHPADGTWSPPVSNDAPAGPVPAPPAVVAPPAGPAFAVTTDQGA
jgi:hypothetical protein